MLRNLLFSTLLVFLFLGFIVFTTAPDRQIAADSVKVNQVSEITRPEGWTEETHEDTATPNYDVVFAQDTVKRIDLVITPDDWQTMLNDMHEKYGEYGEYGCGGSIVPVEACEACEGLQEGDPCVISMMGLQFPGTCLTMPGQRVCYPDNPPPGVIPSGGIKPGEVPPDDLFGTVPEPVYRSCTFKFEGKAWWHVGVRFKGNSSLFYPWMIGTSMKFPFRVDFDYFEDDYPEIMNQRFYGFSELSMSNNFYDDSLLREKVVGDIFREAGVPAPRNASCQLYVDYGEGPIYFGLYIMTEVPRRPMLGTQFGDPDGNLYKPEGPGARWVTFDQASFEKDTNITQSDWSDIQAAFAALHASRSDPETWRTGLEAVFDVDGFLRWLAVNTVIQNWDTYGILPHNYYLYSDPADGLLHWIPWDNNEALKSTSIITDPLPLSLDSTAVDDSWPLIRYLIDDPVYHATYLFFVHDVIEGAFSLTPAQTRLRNAHELISPFVVGSQGEQRGYTLLAGPEDFENELDNLLAHAEQRREDTLQFLSQENFTSMALIINEIHYNPSPSQGVDTDHEFIELYNAGGSTVDLSGYSLTKAVQFTFPQGTTIAANEYILIAKNDDTYSGRGFRVFEWTSGDLSNSGEAIQLKNAQGVVIDFVNYDDYFPWPADPDGNGPSLSLVSPSLNNSFYANWKTSDGLGGTPGRANTGILLNVSSIRTDLATPPNVGQTIELSLLADGQEDSLYYKYLVSSGYQTQNPGSWQLLQDWTLNNTLQWTPPAEGHYILIAYATDNPSGSSFHQAGLSIETSGNSTTPIQITELTTTMTYPQSSETAITITTTATGGNGPLYYKYWYCKGIGGAWNVIQDYSTSSLCTWTPTEEGLYTLVVWVTDDTSGSEYSIAGMTCTIEQ